MGLDIYFEKRKRNPQDAEKIAANKKEIEKLYEEANQIEASLQEKVGGKEVFAHLIDKYADYKMLSAIESRNEEQEKELVMLQGYADAHKEYYAQKHLALVAGVTQSHGRVEVQAGHEAFGDNYRYKLRCYQHTLSQQAVFRKELFK